MKWLKLESNELTAPPTFDKETAYQIVMSTLNG